MLVTGTTGNVGSLLIAHMIEQTPWRIIAPVRAQDDDEAHERVRDTLDYTLLGGTAAALDRVDAIAADVSQPQFGLWDDQWEQLCRRVELILHLAGSVSFGAPRAALLKANVDGTANVLELAANAPHLRRFVHISTAYRAGEAPGRVFEDTQATGPARNDYEDTKQLAEQAVISCAAWLPFTIVRPTIIGGSHDTGFTSGFSVFYPLVKMCADGQLPVLRTYPSGLLDIVPVDWVARSIIALTMSRAAEGNIVHLAAGNDALTIGEFREAIERAGIRPPELIAPEEETIAQLVGRGRVTPEQGEILAWLEGPYGKYLSVDTRFDNRVAEALLLEQGCEAMPPRLTTYFPQLVAYAAATGWGATRISRAEWTRTRQPSRSAPIESTG